MIGGTVHVNDHTILEWTATNEGEVFGGTLYEVHAWGRSIAGHPYDFLFNLVFEPVNAPALVAGIMTAVSERVGTRKK